MDIICELAGHPALFKEHLPREHSIREVAPNMPWVCVCGKHGSTEYGSVARKRK